MRRVRQAALIVAAGLALGLGAGVPAEPLLDVTPAWEHKVTYTPNTQFKPGVRPGYPIALADR